METGSLAGFVVFLSQISWVVLAVAALASLYYIAAFGFGLASLGKTGGGMYERPKSPKEVMTSFLGAVLFGGFTTFLSASYATLYEESAFQEAPVFPYSPEKISQSEDAELTALMLKASFQLIALVFAYGAIQKLIDAGRNDGSEKGALTSAITKTFSAVVLWNPAKTASVFDFIPFFDVLSAMLAGSTT